MAALADAFMDCSPHGIRPRSSVRPPAEDYDKPVPTTKERARSTDLDRAPWLSDPAFGSVVHYSEAMLTNPALRAGSRAAVARQEWPALPGFPTPRTMPSTSAGCAALVAAPGNAHTFADRRIPLGLALKDAAFGVVERSHAVHRRLRGAHGFAA